MPRVRLGLLQTHSRSVDLCSRVLHILILWGGLAMAHRHFGATTWDFYSSVLFVSALVSYFVAAELFGLFDPMRNMRFGQLLLRVSSTVIFSVGSAALVEIFFLTQSHVLPPSFWWAWLGMSLIAAVTVRSIIYAVLMVLRINGRNLRRAIIVGNGPQLSALLERLANSPWLGIVIEGIYTDDELQNALPVLGGVAEAESGMLQQEQLDYVYIALPMRDADFIERLTDSLLDSTATVMLVPDIFSFQLFNSQQGSIDGLPVFALVDRPQSLAGGFVKRLFDICFSLVALSLLCLPMLLIALVIKLDSSGPVIFKQRRYGMDGRPIDVWKFRSMRTMDNGSTVQQASRNDPRVTRVGAFLRRTSLDELPQFINVLQGSMSVVGPRPHAVAHNEQYRKQIKGYMLRHKVKPGITGLAQVNGCRGETDTLDKMQARIDYDLQYLRYWSLWLDIKIIVKTIFVGFVSQQAY